jgi:hypothetical protein
MDTVHIASIKIRKENKGNKIVGTRTEGNERGNRERG